MRLILKQIVFLICICLPLFVMGQDQTALTVNAPEQVYANEPFDVSFSINAKGSKGFKAPAFKGLDLLSGPYQSQSSSFQFVNGKNYQSFNLSYSYRLRAPKEGTYRFEGAEILVDGTKYTSDEINIKVLAERTSSSQQGQNNSQRNSSQRNNSAYGNNSNSQNSDAPTAADIKNEDLFVRSIVNKSNPYLGEEVILTYRLYTAVPVRQYSIYKLPSNKGFWAEELSTNVEDQHTETINGKQYIYVDIRKVALFPQESGKLVIEPLEIEAIVAVNKPRRGRSGDIFDIFSDPFFDQVTHVQKQIKSKPTTINIKSLPENGKPEDYSGLVGNFKVSFTYDKSKEIKANDALTFTFKVSGTGNIALLQAPNILFPPDFEVYEPKTNHRKNNGNTIGGTTTIDYIAVPRAPGIYRIPNFNFSFFNPQKNKYQSVSIPETVLNVKEGTGGTYNAENKNRISSKSSHQDIRPIQTKKPDLTSPMYMFFLSPMWWSIEIMLILLAFVFLYVYRRRLLLKQDVAGTLNKKAVKQAKRCLKKAHHFMIQNKRDEFYIEISQALWGFLSHKLNIPTSDLSIENARTSLSTYKVSETSIETFVSTLEHCEFERFAPKGNTQEDMQLIYNEAINTISQIVKEIK